jgi:hypothetical protein
MNRTFVSGSNPVYADAANKSVKLTAIFEEIRHHGEVPFIASPDDTMAHGPEILQRALAGEFGPIGAFVAPGVPKPPKK